jgi:hypothetical protein
LYPTMRTGGDTMEAGRTPFNSVVEEVARLSEQDLGPSDYYGELLRRLLPSLGAPSGAAWAVDTGRPQMLGEVNLTHVGMDSLGDLQACHDLFLMAAREKGQPVAMAARTAVGGPPDASRPGNPTDFPLFVVPVMVDGKVMHMIEVFTEPGYLPDQQYRMVQMAVVLAGFASTFVRNRKIRHLAGQQEIWQQLESFTRLIHASLKPVEVSYHVANEGRRLIGCDRLTVVQRTGRKAHVEAISGAEVVEKRSNLVRRLAHLGDCVLDLNDKLEYNGAPDDAMPPNLREALDSFLEESGSKVLTVIPIRDPRESDEKEPCRSALVMEAFEQTVEPKLLTERLDIVGKHAATALYNAQEYRTIPLRWMWLPIVALQKGLGGKGRAITAGVAVGVALLFAAMVFIPYPLKMDSKGQLLPNKRAWVFAPSTGHVQRFEVEPNSDVRKSQNLILMHDADLQIRLVNLSKEIESAAQEIQACNARMEAAQKNENERITINIEKRKQESILGLKLSERANLRLLTNSDERNPGFFWVRSPMDGTILNADFKETLTGKFVRPSDPLLRVGNEAGSWEVELKIPQKHVGQVLAAFGDAKELDVDLLLLSDPTHVYKGKLTRDKLAGEASVRREESDESEPVVIATVRVDGDDIALEDRLPRERLLTGTEVHAKIRCGDRALGYSLFYGAWEFFFEKVVFFF